MDWEAFSVSVRLAAATTLLLLPLAVWLARWLANTRAAFKGVIETLVLLPLVLPPTVIGYYLLLLFSRQDQATVSSGDGREALRLEAMEELRAIMEAEEGNAYIEDLCPRQRDLPGSGGLCAGRRI